MIPHFAPSGHSFKWLAEYLTHDAGKAQTAERVAWAHTLNLAHDDPTSAVHEMLMTYENRELLKAEAGVRRGGARLEKPVKHFSLNWHPSEKPTKEQMIAAVESFLKNMGWDEHQALLVAHTDKPHRHVHVMVNAVHPVRGTALKDSHAWRRAQAWALRYELEHGKVFCEERLKTKRDRSPSPPRPAWQKLKKLQPEHAEEAYAEAERITVDYGTAPRVWQGQEWLKLKAHQKAERLAFFAAGKKVYRDARNAMYREVRATFRTEWKQYYQLRRRGISPNDAKALRAGLIARQGAMLDEKVAVASAELRQQRDTVYRDLLDTQKSARAELANRQERGLASPHLWAAPEGPARGMVPHETPQPNFEPGSSQDRARRQQSAARQQTGLRWTERGGMAAQQRSAQRWLDRAAERLSQMPKSEKEQPRSRLAEAAERLAKNEPGKQKAGKSLEIEPDG